MAVQFIEHADRQDNPDAVRDRVVDILGVDITDVSIEQAIDLVEGLINSSGPARSIFFANAHTLNLAASDPDYRQILNSADHVFGDGTGVRWAAKLRGVRLKGNVNGTDFVPALLSGTAGRGYSYYLLGADEETIQITAANARDRFAGWSQAGFHHGFIRGDRAKAVIEQINDIGPDLLLVGMGNPLQEKWIAQHGRELNVRVCMGVGGLFDFWSENVSRAPLWLRRLGHEWIWRLWQQPADKARRYLIGNPVFLARAFADMQRKASS